MSGLTGPTGSTGATGPQLTANKLRSTTVYGSFTNQDNSTGTIQAAAVFQRDVSVGGNLILGVETVDSFGNVIDSNGSIKARVNRQLIEITPRNLSYISNLTSDCQKQLNYLNSNIAATSNFSNGITVGATGSFVNIGFTGNINNVKASTFDYLKNISGDIQTQVTTIKNNSTFNNGITCGATGAFGSIGFTGSINNVNALNV